ncbi:MAG: ribokinase [Anaerolineae bacterium]|nr:ribokinase [Anaerolineae bacterium]MBN8618037.1 ribokinase [Anaerolineae bacterium]
MSAKIVVVGSFNMDLTAYMERMPRPGETVSGRRFVTGPGGKGSNQAVAAARLGAEVTFVGRVGQDVFAESALNFWKQEGINTDYVVRDPNNATGVAPIWVDDKGENSIVVVLGSNLAMTQGDVDRAAEVIAQADAVIVQLEINYDIVEYAMQVAKAKGVRTILNPAPAGKLNAQAVALADYLTPNETELEVLSGMAGTDYEAAARSLLTREGQTAVVTLGSQGAMWVNPNGKAIIPPFKVEVVDTTGAGDAFNGGFAVALGEGKPLEEAIRFGNAVAGLSVTKPGTAPSMPTRAAVEALLARG